MSAKPMTKKEWLKFLDIMLADFDWAAAEQEPDFVYILSYKGSIYKVFATPEAAMDYADKYFPRNADGLEVITQEVNS